MPDDHKELKERLRSEAQASGENIVLGNMLTQAADLIESLEREVEREKARFNRRDRYREEQNQKVLNAMEAAAGERDRNAAVLEALTSEEAMEAAKRAAETFCDAREDARREESLRVFGHAGAHIPAHVVYRNEVRKVEFQAALQHAQEQVDHDS
jgi:hypothetical protein